MNETIYFKQKFIYQSRCAHWVNKKNWKHVLSTIVQMLDVITSFNCYSPMMDWRSEINDILPNDMSFFIYLFVLQLITAARYVLPLRGRSTQSGHFVSLLQQRITCMPTIDISRSDVTPDLSSVFLTLMSHFPSYTPHVPAKPKTLSRQKLLFVFQWRNFDRKLIGNAAALSPSRFTTPSFTHFGIFGLLAAN
jgi:hypothetical protein